MRFGGAVREEGVVVEIKGAAAMSSVVTAREGLAA
jgi:hypothetical protein